MPLLHRQRYTKLIVDESESYLSLFYGLEKLEIYGLFIYVLRDISFYILLNWIFLMFPLA